MFTVKPSKRYPYVDKYNGDGMYVLLLVTFSEPPIQLYIIYIHYYI